jgi:hypothetical protein
MTRFSLAALSACLALFMTSATGESLSSNSEDSERVTLEEVLQLLEKSSTGRAMLQKALRAWGLKERGDVLSRLKWGTASRTDAVLIRHYDSETGKEARERKVTIYLRQNQPRADLMLDLAHELVHATAKPSWDPYDPKLTAGAYIRAAIEGEGGEVDAVRVECEVSNEIFGEKSDSPSAARCRKYAFSNPVEMIRKDFYRVGSWKKKLQSNLGAEKKLFPLLSEEHPALYSSTGGTPYPVALYEEYRQMTAVACENTKRRAPAAMLPDSGPDSLDENARLLLLSRCKN